MATVVDITSETLAQEVTECLQSENIELSDELKHILNKRSKVAETCDQLDSQQKLDKFSAEQLGIVLPDEILLDGTDSYQYVPIRESLKKLI